MKHIKKFESLFKKEIKINDLVHDKYKLLAKSNEIGVVINIMKSKFGVTTYLVAFNINGYVQSASYTKNELINLTQKELDDYNVKNDANKYNL